MGTPNYPSDVGKDLRDLRQGLAKVFTGASLTVPNGRPWMPFTVSDSSTALWPSTTSNTFTSLQVVSGIRSHPSVDFWIKVSAPAAGCEVQILGHDSSVLAGPQAFSSGVSDWNGVLSLPSGIAYYDEFYFTVQARSITSGQTTACQVGRVYGRA